MNEQLIRRVREKLDRDWPYLVSDEDIRQEVRAVRKRGGRRDGGGPQYHVVNMAVARLAPLQHVREGRSTRRIAVARP